MQKVNSKKLLIGLLVCLLLLLGLARFFEFTPKEEFRRVGTVQQLQALYKQLKVFQEKCDRYPSALEGLSALTVERKPKDCSAFRGFATDEVFLHDKWGNPFSYEVDGSNFKVISSGNSWIEIGNDRDLQFPEEPD